MRVEYYYGRLIYLLYLINKLIVFVLVIHKHTSEKGIIIDVVLSQAMVWTMAAIH